MKKPKFLQRFGKKKRLLEQELNYLKWSNDEQDKKIRGLEDTLQAAEDKAIQKKIEKAREEDNLTDPFIQDKYEIVYDCKGNFKSMTFNGIPLNGVQSVNIDSEGFLNQRASIKLEVCGRLNILTEEE